MEKAFRRQAIPEQMEKIKAQVARLSKTDDGCQQAMQLIKEILDAKTAPSILMPMTSVTLLMGMVCLQPLT